MPWRLFDSLQTVLSRLRAWSSTTKVSYHLLRWVGSSSKLQMLPLLLELREKQLQKPGQKDNHQTMKIGNLCFQLISFITIQLLGIPAFFRLKWFSSWDSYQCCLLILYSSCWEVLQEINFKLYCLSEEYSQRLNEGLWLNFLLLEASDHTDTIQLVGVVMLNE